MRTKIQANENLLVERNLPERKQHVPVQSDALNVESIPVWPKAIISVDDSQLNQSESKAPVWEDYKEESAVKKKSDAILWLIFLLLLILVIVFSQREWLARFFPLESYENFALGIEIIRPERNDETVNSKVPLKEFSAPLPEFNSLLRLDMEQESRLESSVQFRNIRLFFVKVENDGKLNLKSVLHKVPFDQSPLSRTVAQLLKGPSPQEINQGLHSMLPPEVQLLNIRISSKTAFMNLSREFYQITKLPAVLLAAVKQLIFTVTEYSTVKAVRILVEGQPIFLENIPENSTNELQKHGINLEGDIRREDLWEGEMGGF